MPKGYRPAAGLFQKGIRTGNAPVRVPFMQRSSTLWLMGGEIAEYWYVGEIFIPLFIAVGSDTGVLSKGMDEMRSIGETYPGTDI